MAENMTADEEHTITQLRNEMKKELPTDMFEDTTLLYKFLKARNFNLTQAECMLRKNLRWRKEMQIDTILTDFKPAEVLTKYVSQQMIGFDKEGCPVRYNAIGNTDTIGVFKSSNHRNVFKYVVQALESDIPIFKSQSKKLGRPVNQIVCIYDMENMTLAKATHKKSIQIFRDGMKVFQDNYPEHLKAFFVINASLYFTIVFPIIKAVLANAVLNKVRIFGKDGWKEELLKLIDADVLPAFLGGNRTDPDGNLECNTFINHGGAIPESYYLTKNPEDLAQKKGATHIKLDRQSTIQIPVQIQQPKSILHWEFETKNYDVGFGLTLDTPSENTVSELIPVHTLDTENEPERGMYRCEKPGTYKIVFDNSHSWFYSKEIYYRMWVTNDADDKPN